MSHLQILLGFVILSFGTVSLSQISVLSRQYPLPFLKSLFRFLLLFNLYFFLQIVLEYYYLNIQTTASAQQFFWISSLTDLLFSAVLLLITWLAISLIHQLTKQQPTRTLTRFFAGLSLFLLLPNSALLLIIGAPGYSRIFFVLMLSYVAVFHLGIILSLLRLYQKHSGLGIYQHTRLRRLASIFITVKILSLIFLSLYILKVVRFNLSFYAVFFFYNLLPIFFLRSTTENLFIDELPPKESLPSLSLDQRYRQFGISKREQEIIELVLAGCSNRDIEDKLFISLATVKDHIYKIYKKTGVRNRVQLVNLLRGKPL